MHYRIVNINDFTKSQLDSALSQMPEKQREYICKKRQPISRGQSIVARIILKNLLLDTFGINDGYNIDFEANGKPYYLHSTDVYFSVSHSSDYVAVAVSNKPIGIDIQVRKMINEKLVNKVCTTDECEYIKNVGLGEFYKLWTVKEAYSKCTGIKLPDVFKLSFVKDNCIFGLDKKLFSSSNETYELSIIE